MTTRWQLDGLDQHLVPEERYSKKIANPLKIKLLNPHYARRRIRSFPTFSPFPAATNPWRHARSDQQKTNQISAKAMKLPGIMDVKGSCLLAQIYMHPNLLDHVSEVTD